MSYAKTRLKPPVPPHNSRPINQLFIGVNAPGVNSLHVACGPNLSASRGSGRRSRGPDRDPSPNSRPATFLVSGKMTTRVLLTLSIHLEQ